MGREILDLPAPPADARIHYGPGEHQFGEVRMPARGRKHPLVITVHGGFWRAQYRLDYMGHMCAALAREGIATWNIEYRRIGHSGGGWPGTLEDVRLAVSFVAELARRFPVDVSQLVATGHSAGGQLALWMAAQRSESHASPVQAAVPLGGVVDLRRAWDLHLSNDVVKDFLGGTPDEVPERYRAASPRELLPTRALQRVVHGHEDEVVPFEMARDYVKAAQAAGDDAILLGIDHCSHFDVIDPASRAWPIVVSAIKEVIVPAPKKL